MLKITLVIILCLLKNNNSHESTVENQLLSNESTIDYLTKSQISPILASGYQHKLTRRSYNRKTIPKPSSNQNTSSNTKSKNVKKTGVPLSKKQVTIAPFNKSRNSGKKPKINVPLVVPFETHDNYPVEVILIHQGKKLIEPYSLSKDDPTLVCCLLDYAVKEILDEEKNLNRPDSYFRYFDMHSITRLLQGENEAELNQKDTLFITQYGSWKDKEIIMPIYRKENKHVAVLVARIKDKSLYYYDPTDADMKNENTNKDAGEMRRMFLNLLGKMNSKVSSDKIDSNGWKMEAPYSQIPPAPNENDKKKDFGIHAVNFIDILIHGRISFFESWRRRSITIESYFDEVKYRTESKTRYRRWLAEQKKLKEEQDYLRKWGEI